MPESTDRYRALQHGSSHLRRTLLFAYHTPEGWVTLGPPLGLRNRRRSLFTKRKCGSHVSRTHVRPDVSRAPLHRRVRLDGLGPRQNAEAEIGSVQVQSAFGSMTSESSVHGLSAVEKSIEAVSDVRASFSLCVRPAISRPACELP